jgi:hypothetical protein
MGAVEPPSPSHSVFCAGILEQIMGDRNLVGIGSRTRPPGAEVGGIDSLESIPGLLKCLKIQSLRKHEF